MLRPLLRFAVLSFALVGWSTAALADFVDEFCTGLAGASSAAAEARNAGVTMNELIGTVQESCYSGDWAGMEAECEKLLGNLVTIVYANPDMTPNDLYNETYGICLDGFDE